MQGGLVEGSWVDPVTYLISGLTRRFAPLEEETRLRVVNELLGFQRRQGETIDALLTRFELTRLRAARDSGGAAQLGVEPLALVLLRACGVGQA
eukprot:4245074-Amphidinium_carterae.1